MEGSQALGGLVRVGVDREPVASVANRQRPGEVTPEVSLLLRVTDDLRKAVEQLLRHLRHRPIKFCLRDHLVDQSPFKGCLDIERLAEVKHLSCSAVAYDDWEPLSCAARWNGASRRADVADGNVVGGNRQVTGNVELVAAPYDHAVQARYRRLTDITEAVVSLYEGAHPLPIVGTLLQEGLLFIEV